MQIFFDTNIWLHYKELRTFDPADFGPGKHTVLIPRVVVRELDKFKGSQKSWQRNRARRALQLIEEAGKAGGAITLQNGLVVKVHREELTRFAWELFNLDPKIPDHKLIAAILCHRSAGNQDILFYTGDITPRLDAGEHNIDARELLDKYREPEELSDEEREIRDLKRIISNYESRIPRLDVGFNHGDNIAVTTKRVLRLYAPGEVLSPDEIENIMRMKREQFPLRASPAFRALPGQGSFMLHPAAKREVMRDLISPASQHNKRVEKFLSDYKEYLLSLNQYFGRESLTEAFSIGIMNRGSMPAEEVDIEIEVPFLEVRNVLAPCPLEPPEPGKGDSEEPIKTPLLDSINQRFRFGKGAVYASYRWTSIKHHHSEFMPDFYVTFPSANKRRSFQLKYRVTCSNLPDPVTGVLNVIVPDA